MVNLSANRLAASGSWAGSSTVGSSCANCFIARWLASRTT
jgi:hypothetical protein